MSNAWAWRPMLANAAAAALSVSSSVGPCSCRLRRRPGKHGCWRMLSMSSLMLSYCSLSFLGFHSMHLSRHERVLHFFLHIVFQPMSNASLPSCSSLSVRPVKLSMARSPAMMPSRLPTSLCTNLPFSKRWTGPCPMEERNVATLLYVSMTVLSLPKASSSPALRRAFKHSEQNILTFGSIRGRSMNPPPPPPPPPPGKGSPPLNV